MINATKPVNIFISYANSDANSRDELIANLAGLKRSEKIKIWNENEIAPGMDLEEATRTNLSQADIVALLISNDFINSDNKWNDELQVSRNRRNHGEPVVLVPILLKPCLLENTFLQKMQLLPRNQKPISKHSSTAEAWILIAKEISTLVNDLHAKKHSANPSNSFDKEYPNWEKNTLKEKWSVEEDELLNLMVFYIKGTSKSPA